MAQNNNILRKFLAGLIITLILGGFAYTWAVDTDTAKAINVLNEKHYLARKETDKCFLQISERLARIEAILERIEQNHK